MVDGWASTIRSISRRRDVGVTILSGRDVAHKSWRDLLMEAEALAADAILPHEVHAIGVVAKSSLDFLREVIAVWLSGRAVVLLQAPPGPGTKGQEGLSRLSAVGSNAVLVGCSRRLVRLGNHCVLGSSPGPCNDATRLVQFTSGTSGPAKPVQVTGNLLHVHVDDVASRLGITEDSRVMVWMPLYHDMGFVAQCLAALARGADLIVRVTSDFVTRPLTLLDDVTEWRVTNTASPSVALGMVARAAQRSSPAPVGQWNLGSLRSVLVAADVIRQVDVDAFTALFESHDFDPTALVAAYGMAEAIVGVTCGARDKGIRFVETPLEWDVASSSPLALLGSPLTGVKVSFATEIQGSDAGESRLPAPILLRGPTIVGAMDSARHPDDWMSTNDLGGPLESELVVTGRSDDMINLAGVKYSPTELECAAEAVDGIRRGNVAAVHVPGTGEGERGRVVIFAEARDPKREALASQVHAAVVRRVGQIPLSIRLVPPSTLPKTTSGKIQRKTVREMASVH